MIIPAKARRARQLRDFPILMSGPMVRALLCEIEAPGTGKIQTRRLLTSREAKWLLGDPACHQLVNDKKYWKSRIEEIIEGGQPSQKAFFIPTERKWVVTARGGK